MKYVIRHKIDGRVVSAEEFRRRSRASKRLGNAIPGRQARTYEAARPLRSMAAACHRSQVTEFNARLKAAGITGAEYKPNGDLIFTSRRARRETLRLRRLRDEDGGYGDG